MCYFVSREHDAVLYSTVFPGGNNICQYHCRGVQIGTGLLYYVRDIDTGTILTGPHCSPTGVVCRDTICCYDPTTGLPTLGAIRSVGLDSTDCALQACYPPHVGRAIPPPSENEAADCEPWKGCCGGQKGLDPCHDEPPRICEEFEGKTLTSRCTSANDVRCWIGCCCPTGCLDYVGECPPECTKKNPAGDTCQGITDPACGQACCLCDRCEDLSASECTAKGGTPMSGSCASPTTREACRLADTKRPCVRGTWQFTRRPPEHPPVGITVRPGRWEPCSVNKQRTLDRAGGSYTEPTECRYSYGYVDRASFGGRWEGKFCNTYNSNCASGIRRRQTLRLVRNGNRWEWQGRYRPPCPEVTDWPLSTAVGCPP